MSNYTETNRKIEVQGEQELENGIVKYNYKSEDSNTPPAHIFFTGISEDVKFRGNFDVGRDSFGFTEEGGEVATGTRTIIRTTIEEILGGFND